MKIYPLLFISLLSFGFCPAQKKATANPPVIVEKIFQGKEITRAGYSLCFEKVILDSRCPSDVTCVRAGEAKILVSIHKDGGSENKTLEIPKSPKQVKTSVEMGKGSLQIYGLQPYPTSKNIGQEKEYYLQVKFKTHGP